MLSFLLFCGVCFCPAPLADLRISPVRLLQEGGVRVVRQGCWQSRAPASKPDGIGITGICTGLDTFDTVNISNGQVPLSPAQAPDRQGWHAELRWCTDLLRFKSRQTHPSSIPMHPKQLRMPKWCLGWALCSREDRECTSMQCPKESRHEESVSSSSSGQS